MHTGPDSQRGRLTQGNALHVIPEQSQRRPQSPRAPRCHRRHANSLSLQSVATQKMNKNRETLGAACMDNIIPTTRLTVLHNQRNSTHLHIHCHARHSGGLPTVHCDKRWPWKNIKLTSVFAALLEAASWMPPSKKVFKMRKKKHSKNIKVEIVQCNG